MPDTTNLIKVSGNDIVNTTVFPDTKLQTLDRRVGKDQLYFDRNLFEQSVDDWTGIPIIYQKDGVHPTDFAAVNRDPVSAAEAIEGRYVGSVSNPRIVVPGGARLMAQLDIEEDEKELVELWQQGRLFPSTAFTAQSDGDRLTSPPIPNHVLLFPAEVDKVLPGDYGAFVNTLEVSPMKKAKDAQKTAVTEEVPQTLSVAEEPKTEPVVVEQNPQDEVPAEPVAEAPVEEIEKTVEEVAGDVAEKQTELDALKAELEVLKADIAALKDAPKQEETPAEEAVPEEEPKPVTNSEEITAEAAAVVAEGLDDEIKLRDEMIAELKAEVEALKAGKTALEEKIKGIEEAAAEAEFNEIVEKLPVGMKATPEQIEALHTDFVAGNMKKMLFTVLGAASTGATRKVGQPFTQSTKVANVQTGVGDLNKPKIKKE